MPITHACVYHMRVIFLKKTRHVAVLTAELAPKPFPFLTPCLSFQLEFSHCWRHCAMHQLGQFHPSNALLLPWSLWFPLWHRAGRGRRPWRWWPRTSCTVGALSAGLRFGGFDVFRLHVFDENTWIGGKNMERQHMDTYGCFGLFLLC